MNNYTDKTPMTLHSTANLMRRKAEVRSENSNLLTLFSSPQPEENRRLKLLASKDYRPRNAVFNKVGINEAICFKCGTVHAVNASCPTFTRNVFAKFNKTALVA